MEASRELSMARYSRAHRKRGSTERRESCKCLSANKQAGEVRDFPLHLSTYLSPDSSGRREGKDLAPSHHSSYFLEHGLKGFHVH